MFDSMGILRTAILIEHPARRGTLVELSDVIVDSGSEYTWAPQPVLESIGLAPERVVEFVTADGRQIERGVGFANIYAAGTSTADMVVFAARGDLVLLGARTLDGLNLRVDLVRRTLVAAGPVPAAASDLTPDARQPLHPHPARIPYLRQHLGVRSPR
jgi:predicted aspartyl protease